jgi:hypothetical protein
MMVKLTPDIAMSFGQFFNKQTQVYTSIHYHSNKIVFFMVDLSRFFPFKKLCREIWSKLYRFEGITKEISP